MKQQTPQQKLLKPFEIVRLVINITRTRKQIVIVTPTTVCYVTFQDT